MLIRSSTRKQLVDRQKLQCIVFYFAKIITEVDVPELQLLASNLKPEECVKLVSLDSNKRNVDDDIPCIRHLLHWNSSPAEGKGNTHEILTHRLRQINRNDLADWLGKSSFVQIGKDLDRALVNTFDELVKEETELPYPVTLESFKRHEEEDPWLQIDVILMATLLGLLGTLLTLICYTVLQKIRQHFRKTKYKKLKQQESEDEEYKVQRERRKKKYTTERSNVATDYIHPDSDSDTDAD
ncbi:uncharacterized protein LOC117153681 [Bombus vancouverensis nearcticus]|uniref:uncharacterized protein LOC117153681 n=1 Tax=Bombus vancouverensis nearcticus TaxID=2705178 RepID=UPI00402B6A4C